MESLGFRESLILERQKGCRPPSCPLRSSCPWFFLHTSADRLPQAGLSLREQRRPLPPHARLALLWPPHSPAPLAAAVSALCQGCPRPGSLILRWVGLETVMVLGITSLCCMQLQMNLLEAQGLVRLTPVTNGLVLQNQLCPVLGYCRAVKTLP